MLGRVPSKREREFLRRITLVMGNRNQLQWDLPALDSFELNRAIYRLPREQFPETRDELIELLDVGDLVNKPVRNLSLGERMKVEIVGVAPPPPAGALPRRADDRARRDDAEAHPLVRRRVQPRHGATVLLTSHYMADVEALCKRVIVIHHGGILFDGALAGLSRPVRRVQDHRRRARRRAGDLDALRRRHPPGRRLGHAARAEGPRRRRVAARLLSEHQVLDLTIEDPPIEDVIELVFATRR